MPTSIPIWSSIAPPVDLTGRSYALLAIGAAAEVPVETWAVSLRVLDVELCLRQAPPGGDGTAWAEEQAASARVGWRFAVAGPEDEVLQSCAAVRAHGALDAEITAHAVDTTRRRVRCTHCRVSTPTDAAVDGTCTCTGCGRTLVVYSHVSRRWAGYMGFMADAELVP